MTVQYFERARFETAPGVWPERDDVLLGRLGADWWTVSWRSSQRLNGWDRARRAGVALLIVALAGLSSLSWPPPAPQRRWAGHPAWRRHADRDLRAIRRGVAERRRAASTAPASISPKRRSPGWRRRVLHQRRRLSVRQLYCKSYTTPAFYWRYYVLQDGGWLRAIARPDPRRVARRRRRCLVVDGDHCLPSLTIDDIAAATVSTATRPTQLLPLPRPHAPRRSSVHRDARADRDGRACPHRHCSEPDGQRRQPLQRRVGDIRHGACRCGRRVDRHTHTPPRRDHDADRDHARALQPLSRARRQQRSQRRWASSSRPDGTPRRCSRRLIRQRGSAHTSYVIFGAMAVVVRGRRLRARARSRTRSADRDDARRGINPLAWLCWFAAAPAVPLVSRNPFYLLLDLLVVSVRLPDAAAPRTPPRAPGGSSRCRADAGDTLDRLQSADGACGRLDLDAPAGLVADRRRAADLERPGLRRALGAGHRHAVAGGHDLQHLRAARRAAAAAARPRRRVWASRAAWR